MTLFRQYFRQQLVGLLIWLGIAFLLVLAMTSVASSMVENGMESLTKGLPEAFKQMIGIVEGLSPVDAYMAMKAGPTVAVLLALYAVLLALGIVTREVDRRTIDFLLAMPVERRQVLLARSAVLAVNTAIMAAAVWATIYLDLTRQGLTTDFAAYAVLLLNCWLVALALGALCLLSSMWLDDYSLGVKLWVGVAAGGFVLEYVLKAMGVSRWARFWSPFSFVDAPAVIHTGSMPLADVLILVAVILLGFGLSLPVFERKQVSA